MLVLKQPYIENSFQVTFKTMVGTLTSGDQPSVLSQQVQAVTQLYVLPNVDDALRIATFTFYDMVGDEVFDELMTLYRNAKDIAGGLTINISQLLSNDTESRKLCLVDPNIVNIRMGRLNSTSHDVAKLYMDVTYRYAKKV